MESVKGPLDWPYHDILAARRTADEICHVLSDFIPRASYKDAHEHIFNICLRHGIEMTSKQMRKEYEAWKSLQLKGLELSSLLEKPES